MMDREDDALYVTRAVAISMWSNTRHEASYSEQDHTCDCRIQRLRSRSHKRMGCISYAAGERKGYM